MGTNYFAKVDECEHCGRAADTVHIGKSSSGWKFLFQYNQGTYYDSIENFAEWLKDKTIIDEYGQEISYDAFWHLVKAKQEEGRSHFDRFSVERGYEYTGRYLKLGKFEFADHEFS